MFDKIYDWFKKLGENFESWKKEQDRRQRQWEKKQNKEIPPSLEKLIEMYPLLKLMDYYNPLLVDPEDDSGVNRDEETVIIFYQREEIRKID